MPLNVHLEGIPENLPAAAEEKWWADFNSLVQKQQRGFFQIIDDDRDVSTCREALAKVPDAEHFIHLGIGGSSLGTEALISALAPTKNFTFIDNIDPDTLAGQLDAIDPSRSLIHAVSKSGTTAETLAGLSLLRQKFGDEFSRRTIVTGGATGPLQDLAKREGIPLLTIPEDLGGRYSVLSPVGLLPALWAGIDPGQLLAGARRMKEGLSRPLLDSARAVAGLATRGVNQTVLMPYSSALRDFGRWFVQLWAESLGKKYRGLTPLAACGATDQHSQMQLFMEGPRDKLLVFVEVESFRRDFPLTPPPDSFAGRHLSELFKAELYATLRALREEERPHLRLTISAHDAPSLGELFFFFQSLTVLVGTILSVNPFDQPGVEKAKRYTWLWPSSP